MSLTILRHRTAAAHKRLEERLNLFARVKSREEYGSYLRKMHYCVRELENNLDSVAGDFPFDWETRKKLPWLEQDLLALGLRGGDSASARRLAPILCVPSAMGALYVLEGSMLGGRVICKHYGDLLGLTETSGLRYFSGYGASTGEKWKEFLAGLEQCILASELNATQVSHSARNAFGFFEEVLCE